MSLQDTIGELFKDENLPEVPKPKELPKISLNTEPNTNVEAVVPKSPEELAEIDRRKHTRIDIAHKKLELRFSNQIQFARQYIENISLGGLFVKTELKPKMGERLTVEFSVSKPGGSGSKTFALDGKVCRVAEQGVGLEFINVPRLLRAELEEYVSSVLPSGQSLTAKPRISTKDVEHLEMLRAEKLKIQESRRNLSHKYLVIFLLICLNGLEVMHFFKSDENDNSVPAGNRIQSIQVSGRSIQTNQIRSIQNDKAGQIVLTLEDGSTIAAPPSEVEQNIPYYLRQTLQVLKAIPQPRAVRHSQTSRLTELR